MNINPDKFRVRGNRMLVRTLPMPELTQGGLHLLGRQDPTVGTLLANKFGPMPPALVQWNVGPLWDSKKITEDILLLDYDDINLILPHKIEGLHQNSKAVAFGDRILVSPETWLEQESLLQLPSWITSRMGCGRVLSVGFGKLDINRRIPNDPELDDIVIFFNHKINHIRFDNKTYNIVRNEDCLATIETDDFCFQCNAHIPREAHSATCSNYRG